MEIPHTALALATLHNLVEEFVTREGTDYGNHVYSLQDKVRHVIRQLEQGSAVIVYDSKSATCHIETRESRARQQDPPIS
jgi:uncharacterized protein